MKWQLRGIVNVIRQILSVDREITLAEIYEEVEKRMYINPDQMRITYGHPNYEHTVRSILSDLVQTGQAVRVGKGIYKGNPPSTS